MEENQNEIDQLLAKLNQLVIKQAAFSREVSEIRNEINRIKSKVPAPEQEKIEKEDPVVEKKPEIKKETVQLTRFSEETPTVPEDSEKAPPKVQEGVKFNIEKFIGENLISKIGIAVTIIGVSIGVKYTIEHDLISPLVRILLGYLMGLGLLGFGIKLKAKYLNFSAVLVSGGMAIMYFITYAAYSFYGLIPLSVAFALMAVFTIFTVVAAISYDKEIIAHIGLVGAYAIPFILNDSPGEAGVLFSYMAIINIGILVIAFKKYWKPLYYVAFLLSWAIYGLWYMADYKVEEHFGLALIFLSLFFVIFYLTFLAYKLIQKERYSTFDILLLLANSFVFYGLGYLILDDHETGKQLLGLFTLGNAIVHFIVSVVIYKQKLGDRNLFYLITGLVLVFITIAIPVQLDGHWVTLLWAGEAALLFWIGRTKGVPIYEYIAYALIALAFFSILEDWTTVYNIGEESNSKLTPIFNINFLTSVLLIASLAGINWVHRNKKYTAPVAMDKGLLGVVNFGLPALLVFVIYASLIMEIGAYFDQLFADSLLSVTPEDYDYAVEHSNYDIPKFRTIWLINFSLLFLALLSFINIKKIKDRTLGMVTMVLNLIAVNAFLILGLYTLSELRESYLDQNLSEYYSRGIFNIAIRYISLAFFAGLLILCYQYTREKFMKMNLKMVFDLILHVSVLWILSSELISWMDIADSGQSYKLGLSILWGVYALLLISIGIWKRKAYLRIGAITLFAITLLKLFFYDVAHLNTIAKTIVFVSLGVLLLIISFLYNKYKHLIFDEIED
jgi:uncharacterized membrane protein